MSYFDYLRMNRLEDTKDIFIKYLIDTTDWSYQEIINYVKTYGGFYEED